MQPSEILQEFLDFLDTAIKESENAYAIVGEEDRKVQDFLHAFEFEPKCEERSKIATAANRSRVRRRKAKDIVTRYEKVVEFAKSQNGKLLTKNIRHLIQEQKKKEDYLNGERHYKKRGGEEN